jgi:hypothetical protein
VHLQIKVINRLTSSIIITFTTPTSPILTSVPSIHKNENSPKYVKTSINLAFTISERQDITQLDSSCVQEATGMVYTAQREVRKDSQVTKDDQVK